MRAAVKFCQRAPWFILGAAAFSDTVPLLPAIVAAVGLALVALAGREPRELDDPGRDVARLVWRLRRTDRRGRPDRA